MRARYVVATETAVAFLAGAPGAMSLTRAAVGFHALFTVLTLVLLSGAANAEADLQAIEALVADVEAAEQGDASVRIPDDLDGALNTAIDEVDRYIESHPDDVAALIMVARLARLRRALGPVIFRPAQEEGWPQPEFGPAHAALARALQLAPDNAEAHYWQARLYGLSSPTTVEGKLQYRAEDLDLAIEHARRAAALAPANRKYHEAVALYLLQGWNFEAALGAIQDVDDGRHPIALLLADLAALPLPAEAVYLPTDSHNYAEFILQRGRITDHPNVRARVYAVPLKATEVEAFYRRHWPEFRFIDGENSIFGQHLEFTEGVAKPVAHTAEDIQAVPSGGVGVALNEINNAPDDIKTRFNMTAANFSVLFLVNFRKFDEIGR